MSDDKEEKRGRRRKAAVAELLSTEKTYVHLMSKLVEHFMQKLRSNSSILSSEDYKILFPSDIHAILGLNQTFLKDLTNVIESDNFNNKNTKIGDIIYSFCPHFKMYQNYLNNYSAAATRLSKLRSKSSSSFSNYCKQQQDESYFNKLPLESLIILPIQRMPRYKMLLEEIIKHTDANHPDLTQLKNALQKISQVNGVINERMKEFDSRIKVQNIEDRFNGKLSNLVTPSRRFIKEGMLCKIETKDDQDFLFILFSDCILYASQSLIGDKLIFGNLLNFNSKFITKETSNQINVHKIENLFEIHSSKESFMLYAASKKEMNEWVDIINKTFTAYMALDTVKNQTKRDIYAATLQIPNDFADKCMVSCNTKFSFVNRRHHCKYCGFVVCSKCSGNQLQSRPTEVNTNTEMVRVCDVCYKKNAEITTMSTVTTPSLTSKPSTKALELLGYTNDDAKKKKTLKSFNKIREDDLLKMYQNRYEQVEAEEKAEEKAPARNKPPPPKKKDRHAKQNSAVLDFLKLDIEPKLVALETDNTLYKKQVGDFMSENDKLKEMVKKLEREIADNKYKASNMENKMKKHNDELIVDKNRLQALVDKLSSTTDEKKKVQEIQNTKIKTLETHNNNLENELKQKEDEIKKLLDKQHELMNKLDTNQYDKMEDKIREQDQHIQSLVGKFGRLQEIQKEMDEMTQAEVKSPESMRPQPPQAKITMSVSKKSPIVTPSLESVVIHDDSKKPEPSFTETYSISSRKPETPTTEYNTAMKSLYSNERMSKFMDDRQEPPKRVCQTCNKEIVGRALRTKGGLHHRKCHVCYECKASLAGKKYGITVSNGKKIKLCEQCTTKANEKRKEEFNFSKINTVKKKKSIRKISLRDQMNQFRVGGTVVPKPWEADLKKNKAVKNTLKPSNMQGINENNNKTVGNVKARLKKAKSVSKVNGISFIGYGPRKKNQKSNSLMAQRKCSKCKSAIFGKNSIEGPNNTMYHPNCFRCGDCDNELQAKDWRSYPVKSKKAKNNTLTLCPKCAKKREEALFSQHQGKLKLNI